MILGTEIDISGFDYMGLTIVLLFYCVKETGTLKEPY